jgi:NAD(P)-dependent dehydrogenase (short-subunit alcohol dehydrogenase family)
MMRTALIIGAGPGISFSFAKKLAEAGYRVALGSRNVENLTPLCESIGATPFTVDCSSSQSVVDLFTNVENHFGIAPHVVLYNASAGRSVAGECGTIDYAAAAAIYLL